MSHTSNLALVDAPSQHSMHASHCSTPHCSTPQTKRSKTTESNAGESSIDVQVCEDIEPSAVEALQCLLKAYQYSQILQVNSWDFAVEIDFLSRLGIGANELRWLVGAGVIEQAEEITSAGDDRRNFGPGGYLTFDSHTCFILTQQGVSIANEICERHLNQVPLAKSRGTRERDSHRATLLKPTWIADRQQLYLGDDLIKEFKLPAMNQTTILATFEEEGWPPHVDDPLPMCPTVGPKERLRYTIKSLNKHQKKRMIRFRGDGRGEGICWEIWEHPLGAE